MHYGDSWVALDALCHSVVVYYKLGHGGFISSVLFLATVAGLHVSWFPPAVNCNTKQNRPI